MSDAPSLPEWARSMKPGDQVLLVTTSDNIAPLPEAAELARRGVKLTRVPEPRVEGLEAALRDPEGKEWAWSRMVEEIDAAVDELSRLSRGTVHVFCEAPHPIAFRLGWVLGDKLRSRHTILYQHNRRPGSPVAWGVFLDSEHAAPGGDPSPQALPYFAGWTELPPLPGDEGTVLACSTGTTLIKVAQVQAHARRVRVARAVMVEPSASPDPFIQPGAQAHEAAAEISEQLRRTVSRRPQRPIHFLTTANAALLVGVGARLPASVIGGTPIYLYQYDSAGSYDPETPGVYLPRLELTTGRTHMRLERPRLRIYEKEGAVLYRLDGRLLEAARPYPVPLLPPVAEPPSGRAELLGRAREWSARLLTPTVVQEIKDHPELDIQIEVTNEGQDPPWELLWLDGVGEKDPAPEKAEGVGCFAATRSGWTLYRAAGTRARPLAPPTSGQLSVLVVAAFPRGDSAASQVDLLGLVAQLDGTGVRTHILSQQRDGSPPTLEQIQAKVAACRPDVVHWVGHGSPDQPGGGVPILQAGPGWPGGEASTDTTAFLQIFRDHAPRLLILCACSVGQQGKGYGAPQQALLARVDHVIAFREEVGVYVINDFSKQLYTHLAKGEELSTSLTEVRASLLRDYRNEASDAFSLPVLFTSSGVAHVPLRTQTAPGASDGEEPATARPGAGQALDPPHGKGAGPSLPQHDPISTGGAGIAGASDPILKTRR